VGLGDFRPLPSPSGVQGRSPGGGLGAKPPEADGIVLNKDTQTLFPVRRHHLQVAREFYCTTLNPPGGVGDGSPPAGSRGGAPVSVWGLRPQKLTA